MAMDAINESDRPLISVMILCYNYGHLLKRALEACEQQTFLNFEVIMINNGSTDDTEKVYQSFCETNPKVKARATYVKIKENRGPTLGWYKGLKCASGTYVMFHDADDWMEKDCLEKLARKALETDADRVVGGYQEVQADGTVSRVRKFPQNAAQIPSIMLQGVIFRHSIITNYDLYFPEVDGYDLWFTVNFALNERSRALVDDVVYNYYITPNSGTQRIIEQEEKSKKLEMMYRDQIKNLSVVMGKASDSKFRAEIEYWAVRSFYYSVLEYYLRFPTGAAKKHYNTMCADMKRYFPDYKKNSLIWPFQNGFEFVGSLGCAGIYVLDRLHLMGWLSIFAKVLRHGKFFRKI